MRFVSSNPESIGYVIGDNGWQHLESLAAGKSEFSARFETGLDYELAEELFLSHALFAAIDKDYRSEHSVDEAAQVIHRLRIRQGTNVPGGELLRNSRGIVLGRAAGDWHTDQEAEGFATRYIAARKAPADHLQGRALEFDSPKIQSLAFGLQHKLGAQLMLKQFMPGDVVRMSRTDGIHRSAQRNFGLLDNLGDKTPEVVFIDDVKIA